MRWWRRYTGVEVEEVRRMELLARRMMRTMNLSRVRMQEKVFTTITHTVSLNNTAKQYQGRYLFTCTYNDVKNYLYWRCPSPSII